MESSGAMDLVCDNLDVITLTCPESQDPIFQDSPMHVEDDERDELLGLGSLAPSVELEEQEALLLLDSPTSSPPSTPAPPPASNTLHPFGATDIRTMTEEERASRKKAKEEEEERAAKKRAKKALKKKRSKEVKKQKKALEPQGIDWSKDAEADAAASDPRLLLLATPWPLQRLLLVHACLHHHPHQGDLQSPPLLLPLLRSLPLGQRRRKSRASWTWWSKTLTPAAPSSSLLL